jgi:curli production assembly/transport component CsgG|tara:strand:+ start:6038 stop:6775 length:738 start_codon:yes stop_codon:yes gene_type:complete
MSGCATLPPPQFEPPTVSENPLQEKMDSVPELDGDTITIAVYSFGDKTGQRKPSNTISNLSSAVTQGAETWVIKALQEVGNGTWFKVVERTGIDNLVKERQLIRSTRERYEDGHTLKPLTFAGLLLEGGVVGYDTITTAGGTGARYLGIGASQEYSIDTVTVVMRLISVNTGEVLLSVATEKTIASYRSSIDIFKFLDLGTKTLEFETGIVTNEPVNYATRSAIEAAVIQLINKGATNGLWKFKE